MVNRVVSSFQSLRASSLVAAFVLNLLLSLIFFCFYYLYFIIGALSAYSHCNFVFSVQLLLLCFLLLFRCWCIVLLLS